MPVFWIRISGLRPPACSPAAIEQAWPSRVTPTSRSDGSAFISMYSQLVSLSGSHTTSVTPFSLHVPQHRLRAQRRGRRIVHRSLLAADLSQAAPLANIIPTNHPRERAHGNTFRVGDMTIHRIVEMECGFTPRSGIPARPEARGAGGEPVLAGARRRWMRTDNLVLCFQSYIVQTPRHTILVDSCIGNDKDRTARPLWHQKKDDAWMRGLAAAGLTVNDIDFVMCTHLHVDHVGWNTRLENGRWVPTFPKARYLFSKTELDYWLAENDKAELPPIADSVIPIVEAKRCDLVTSDHAVDDTVSLLPTPGHTIDHYAVAAWAGRQGRGHHRRPDPLRRCRRAIPSCRCAWTTIRSRARDAPEVPGDLLRHQHAVLLRALPVAVARLREALGRGVPLRVRHRLTRRHAAARLEHPPGRRHAARPASWPRSRAMMPTC